jgi:hypothetical protein
MPKHDPNKLSVIYDNRQKDFVVKYPRRCDGGLATNHLVGDQLNYRFPFTDSEFSYPNNYELTNFIKELESRGYDIKTLKFSIELKK